MTSCRWDGSAGGSEQRRGEQQIVRCELVFGDVGLELVGDVGGELDAAVFAVFGVVLDQEPAAGGVELRDQLDRDPADGEHPHPRVQIGRSEFDEFGPAQPGLDQHLSHQPRGVGRERGVELVELVRGDDRAQLLRHRRRLHAAARVQPGDLVVERGREHRGQDGVALPDHGRRRPGGLQIRHPLADVGGLDLVDPHRPEHRQDVLVQVVGVGLAGPGFHLVVGEPDVFDVAAEPLPRPAGVAGPRRRPAGLRPAATPGSPPSR